MEVYLSENKQIKVKIFTDYKLLAYLLDDIKGLYLDYVIINISISNTSNGWTGIIQYYDGL